MVTQHDERLAFARRLNAALDRAGQPPKGAGRQTALAKMMHVSQKGARKWLEGEAMPELKRIPPLARLLGVRAQWLLSGEGSMQADAEPPASPVMTIACPARPQYSPASDPHPAAERLFEQLRHAYRAGWIDDSDLALLSQIVARFTPQQRDSA